VADNIAHGIDPAGIDTGVATLLIDAGQFIRTFAVADTFVPAVRWRSDKFLQARAGSLVIDDLALRVRSTWRWLTRIKQWRRFRGFKINKDNRLTRNRTR
jgi:hypothetical protein